MTSGATRHSSSILCIAIAAILIVVSGCVTGPGTAQGSAVPRSWRCVGEGVWSVVDRSPMVIQQRDPACATSLVVHRLKGRGAVWRCLVEPGPATKEAGIWFGATPDLSTGYLLTLGGKAPGAGVALRDASGNVLWEDPSASWTYYTPYVLEGMVEKGRVRAQVLRWDRTALVAQSDWFETPGRNPRHRRTLALYTNGGAARFHGWERAKTPLSPKDLAPNSHP